MKKLIQDILIKNDKNINDLEPMQPIEIIKNQYESLIIEYMGTNETKNKYYRVGIKHYQNKDTFYHPCISFVEILDQWQPIQIEDIQGVKNVYVKKDNQEYISMQLKRDILNFILLWKNELKRDYL